MYAATVSWISVNSFAISYQKENICHQSSPECFYNGSCYLSWYLGCWASEQHPKEINTEAGVQPCSFAAFWEQEKGDVISRHMFKFLIKSFNGLFTAYQNTHALTFSLI